ncbi:MAG: hypothetical protein ACI8Z1_000513 [Candidatus Azotimanducaceae bacterium]|jgi:hypothetical protein
MLLKRCLEMRAAIVIGFVFLLQSCTTSVVVEGSLPTPLVEKIPARVGIYYSDDFRHFQHEETIRDSGSWNINLGQQNMMFFKRLMSSLFEEVVEIDAPPETSESMLDFDGIVIPEIEKFGFLTPNVSGLKFYSASIEYRIVMFDRTGDKVGDWNIVGYGKSEGGLFSADDAINESTVLAIRDGGARIAIELIDQPAVREWIDRIGPIESVFPEPEGTGREPGDITDQTRNSNEEPVDA